MAPVSQKIKKKQRKQISSLTVKKASPKSKKKEKTNEVTQDIEDESAESDEELFSDDTPGPIDNIQQESTGLITTTNVEVYQLSELTEESINKLQKNRRDLALAQKKIPLSRHLDPTTLVPLGMAINATDSSIWQGNTPDDEMVIEWVDRPANEHFSLPTRR